MKSDWENDREQRYRSVFNSDHFDGKKMVFRAAGYSYYDRYAMLTVFISNDGEPTVELVRSCCPTQQDASLTLPTEIEKSERKIAPDLLNALDTIMVDAMLGVSTRQDLFDETLPPIGPCFGGTMTFTRSGICGAAQCNAPNSQASHLVRLVVALTEYALDESVDDKNVWELVGKLLDGEKIAPIPDSTPNRRARPSTASP